MLCIYIYIYIYVYVISYKVTDVWVRGRRLLANRKLLTLDVDDVKAASVKWGDRRWNRDPRPQPQTFSKLVFLT